MESSRTLLLNSTEPDSWEALLSWELIGVIEKLGRKFIKSGVRDKWEIVGRRHMQREILSSLVWVH
jgi:hypothetical protein